MAEMVTSEQRSPKAARRNGVSDATNLGSTVAARPQSVFNINLHVLPRAKAQACRSPRGCCCAATPTGEAKVSYCGGAAEIDAGRNKGRMPLSVWLGPGCAAASVADSDTVYQKTNTWTDIERWDPSLSFTQPSAQKTGTARTRRLNLCPRRQGTLDRRFERREPKAPGAYHNLKATERRNQVESKAFRPVRPAGAAGYPDYRQACRCQQEQQQTMRGIRPNETSRPIPVVGPWC